MSEMLTENRARTPTEENIAIIKASKVIEQMQMDALQKFPIEMRVTYLLNLLGNIMKNTDDVSDFDARVNWQKINKILQLETSSNDFNIFDEIKTVTELQELRNIIIFASCGLGPWQKKKCKDCGKEFFLNKSEMDFFIDKGLSTPVRCKSCREKRKNSHK